MLRGWEANCQVKQRRQGMATVHPYFQHKGLVLETHGPHLLKNVMIMHTGPSAYVRCEGAEDTGGVRHLA